MDGLIIKEHWLDKILHNNKTLEIRNNNTTKLNTPIYLLESNTQKIRAIATITNTIKLNKNNWEELRSQHQVEKSFDELLNIYKNPHAWNIKINKIIPEELFYEHKNGSIIWVCGLLTYEEYTKDFIYDYDF